MEQKSLEVILVNYNSSFWIKKTLDSLYKFFVPNSKYKIIITIVDNASSDDSVSMIENQFPQVKLIKSDKNLGFSAGNNLALKTSTSDYIMLLNSDTELTEKSKNFDILIDYLEQNSSAGIITPKILLPSGKLDMACHRGEPSLLDCLFYFAGFEKLFPKIKIFTRYHLLDKDFSTIHEIDVCTGACMIMRNKDLKDVGYFDERFFMYSEDMDLCRSFREKGYKIIYNPNVEIIHHKYKSGLQSDDKKIKKKISKHFYNSFLIYYDKWYKDKIYYKILRPFISLLIKIV